MPARGWTVWPHLVSGSKMKAFSADDPDPAAGPQPGLLGARRHRHHPRAPADFPEIDKGKTPGPVTLEDGSVLAGVGNLRMGGQLWFGEDDARAAVVETVEAADRTGRLRGILEAVRSHRVEDDFSSHWSYAAKTSNASCTGNNAR